MKSRHGGRASTIFNFRSPYRRFYRLRLKVEDMKLEEWGMTPWLPRLP